VSDSAQLEIAPDAEPTANLATRATKLLPQTEPTFTTRRGAVWTGDALDLLKAMPKASVNLVVTSPPYALEFQKEYGNKPQDAYVEWFLPFAKEIRRVLKKTAVSSTGECNAVTSVLSPEVSVWPRWVAQV